MPYSNLRKASHCQGRWDYDEDYTCGLNALNMAWCMLGYNKSNQWDLSNYPYTYFFRWKWGLHSSEFAKRLIEPYFKTFSWEVGDNMPWDVIDNTDFSK